MTDRKYCYISKMGSFMTKFKLLLLSFLVFAGTVGAMQYDDDLGDQLLDAALFGLPEVVAFTLDCGVSVDYANYDGWTALMKAANRGHRPVVQLLLDRGAVVNHPNIFGLTALMLAATSENNKDCCETIVNRLMRIPNETQR